MESYLIINVLRVICIAANDACRQEESDWWTENAVVDNDNDGLHSNEGRDIAAVDIGELGNDGPDYRRNYNGRINSF